jgi:G3E family GTPase/ankyrin repeat protein
VTNKNLDQIIIETTGMADPAPVAQTFFVDTQLQKWCYLDAIITVVDAKHIHRQLTRERGGKSKNEPAIQLAFADKIILNKIDLMPDEAERDCLKLELRRYSPTAEIIEAEHSQVDPEKLLCLEAFNLDKVLVQEPNFLEDRGVYIYGPHSDERHDDSISSLCVKTDEPMSVVLLQQWIDALIPVHGENLFRYKGVINMMGAEKRFVLQGVHMLFSGSFSTPWEDSAKKESTIIFIGRHLPKEQLEKGFLACSFANATKTAAARKKSNRSEECHPKPSEYDLNSGVPMQSTSVMHPQKQVLAETAATDGQEDLRCGLCTRTDDLITAVKRNDPTAIAAAAEGHEEAMIKALDSHGNTALHYAASEGHIAAISWLVKHGADVHARNENGDTALHCASEHGHIAAMERLTCCGARLMAVSKSGATAVHCAASKGHIVVLEWLAAQGVDIDTVDDDGAPPLHFAANNGHVHVVDWLAKYGADLARVTKSGCTSLHAAACGGHVATVAWMTGHGADVTTKDKDGRSVLHYAALKGGVDAIDLLVEHGADLTAVDKDGATVLHFVVAYGHVAASAWLAKRVNNDKILKAFTRVAHTPTPGTELIVQKLMQLFTDRVLALQEARGYLQEKDGSTQCLGYDTSDKLKKAKDVISRLLVQLPEDSHALELQLEVKRLEEEASEAAIASLLEDWGSDEATKRSAVGRRKKRKKKIKKKKTRKNSNDKQTEPLHLDDSVAATAGDEGGKKEHGSVSATEGDWGDKKEQIEDEEGALEDFQEDEQRLVTERQLQQQRQQQNDHDQHHAHIEANATVEQTKELQEQVRKLTAENARLSAIEAHSAKLAQVNEDLGASLRGTTAKIEDLTVENSRLVLCSAGLKTEVLAIQTKFELLELMYQPIQIENEQRKTMLADLREISLKISRSRQDLELPIKRMGELDSAKLSQIGVPIGEISRLQGVVCDPNFYPWRIVQREGGAPKMTPNWADEQLSEIIQTHNKAGDRGQQVAVELLRCSRELQQWNPSGGYCVSIPYHHTEERELRPAELLKLAVGMSVPGCRVEGADTYGGCEHVQQVLEQGNRSSNSHRHWQQRTRPSDGAGAGSWVQVACSHPHRR